MRPPMMTKAGAAVVYRGARCYFSKGKNAFRCVLDPAVSPSDKSFPWGADRKAAWTAMLKWVDAEK